MKPCRLTNRLFNLFERSINRKFGISNINNARNFFNKITFKILAGFHPYAINNLPLPPATGTGQRARGFVAWWLVASVVALGGTLGLVFMRRRSR